MKKQSTLMEMEVLYQNKRTAVLDCSKNPNHGMEGYQLLVWDKFMDLPMGWGNRFPDGSCKGFVIYGPHSIDVGGKTIQDFAVDTLAEHKWVLEH